MEHAIGVRGVEGLNDFALKCKDNNIPFFYISCNFGPYTTLEFKNSIAKLLSNVTDICFRDIYSFEQFKNIHSVRYAPDAVFTYKMIPKTMLDTVGISVIGKDLKQCKDRYYNLLMNSIINYVEQGKQVYLFSFCQIEGDEITIDYILNNLPEKYRCFVKDVRYSGNLEEFIKIYSEMEYVVCTRFHSMILSHIFNQKKYVLSYSEKTDNVIRDLNLCSNFITFKEVCQKNLIKLEEFECKKMDSEIEHMSQEQFRALDDFLTKVEEI